MDQADVLRANPAALPVLPGRTASPAPNLLPVIARIVEARCSIPASRSVLAAVTGIDFKTALEWVIARGQEGLPVDDARLVGAPAS